MGPIVPICKIIHDRTLACAAHAGRATRQRGGDLVRRTRDFFAGGDSESGCQRAIARTQSRASALSRIAGKC